MSSSSASFAGTLAEPALYAPNIGHTGLGQEAVPLLQHAETGEDMHFDLTLIHDQGRADGTAGGIMGNRGAGKTALMMEIAWRNSRRDFGVGMGPPRISVDIHRNNAGLPEFRRYCAMENSEMADLKNYSFNFLDPELGMDFGRQLTFIRLGLERMKQHILTTDEKAIIRFGLLKMQDLFPKTAEPKLLVACVRSLGKPDLQKYRDAFLAELDERHSDDVNYQVLKQSLKAKSDADDIRVLRLLDAADQVALLLEELLEGTFGKLFGGKHSLAKFIKQRVSAFNYVGLGNDGIFLFQTLLWMIKMSAIEQDRRDLYPQIELHDENSKLWRFLPYAQNMSDYLKMLRGTGSWVIFGTHRPADYTTVGDAGSQAYALANNAMQEIDIWLYGKMKPKAARQIQERHEFSNMIRRQMQELSRGHWVLIIGDEKPVIVKNNLTPIEQQMSYSHGATQRNLVYSA